MTPYDWKNYGYAKSPFRLPTERAALVVLNAGGLAAQSGHADVEAEHILLALAAIPDSMAARILTRLGVSLDAVRTALEREVAFYNAEGLERERLLSSPAKRVIDYAYEEACLLDNRFIGVEHLLLGLLREEEGVARRVLSSFGLQLEDVRRETNAMKWG